MTDQMQNTESPTKAECPAAREPAVRLFIVAAILIGFGAWCFVDVRRGEYPPKMKDGNTSDVFSYWFNQAGAFVFPLLGLVPLGLAAVSLRRKLVADDEGIGYVGKKKIPWSEVRSLDATKLADKGILRLHHESGGKEKILILDSWKLQNFRSLVQLVEKKVPSGS